jgi:hypothetical protein
MPHAEDASKEAVRKFQSNGSRITSCSEMLYSGAYGSVVPHMSTYIVGQITDTIKFLNHKRLEARKNRSKPEWSFEVFATKSATNLVRSSCSVATSALGAAVGTLILPGWGTSMGVLVGDTICYLL